jgi:hypothetical protein
VGITMLASHTMQTATTNTNERLTWDEMCQRYPNEWVVVVEIKPVDPTLEMNKADDSDDDADVHCVPIEECTAVVITHGKHRKSLSPEIKAAFQHRTSVGAFFTGRLIPPAYERLKP